MKATILLIILLFFTILVKAQVSKTVELTAGTLNIELTAEERNTVTNLTITGTINARDFRTMRDSMPVLAELDIRNVDITAYEGMDGTNNVGNQYDSWSRFPVDEIPVGAFSGKISLQSIQFPLSCTSIESAAFSLCSGLRGELNLPSTILKIGFGVFNGCTSLTGQLIIPPLVTYLESSVFNQCSGITSLTIPPSVKTIESGTFAGCSALQLIEAQSLMPVPLTLNQEVFEGVDYSTCILKVPYGTKERYASAAVWEEFTTIIEQESGFLLSATDLRFSKEEGTDNSISLTANVEWTAVSDQEWLSVSPASGNSDQIVIVTVEANPTVSAREGTLLFSSDGLDSQSIKVTQNAVTTAIEITPGGLSEALSDEEKQTVSSLTLTGSMDARDFNTIRYQMPMLVELDITEVDIEAYTDTTFGNQIEHPSDAIPFAIHEWIDENQTSYALSEHPTLAVIKLPHSLKTLGYRAFYACYSLRTVEMQSSVEKIGIEAFLNCTTLTDINLPSSLTLIDEAAFRWCSGLVSIELPSSLEVIKSGTFSECRALKSIVIPTSVTDIEDGAFKGCSSLESVTIPSSITTIGIEAFMDCSSLTTVIIPPGVTLIGASAFLGCSALESLTLPESLTAMKPDAFAECIRLDTIYSYAASPPDLDNDGGSWVFDNVDKENCLLYVPIGTKEMYASAYEWEDFENILEMSQFSLEETTLTLEADANSQATVKLHSSLQWTAISDQAWLTVDPSSGSGGQLLTLTAEANPDTARTALVTISADGVDSLVLTVTQQAMMVGVDELDYQAQVTFYPNPFTAELSIVVTNPLLKEVTIEIYSMSGQKIRSLARALKGANISLHWNGNDEQGKQVPYGLYLLKVNGQAKKVVFGK